MEKVHKRCLFVLLATTGLGLLVAATALVGVVRADAADGVSEKWRTLGEALQQHAATPPESSPSGGASVGDKGYVWNMGSGEQDVALRLRPDPSNGEEIYTMCAPCHKDSGWGEKDGSYPQVAGQHYEVTVKQLADIRALNRDNPTMYIFALPSQIGGAQAVADVAAYIQTLPMTTDVGTGSGKDLEHGKALYENLCANCHGQNGEGNAQKFYPRLQAQHYNYMMRQYEWIRDGRRRNANPDMIKQMKDMSMRDQMAVLDYVSRLQPAPELLGTGNP